MNIYKTTYTPTDTAETNSNTYTCNYDTRPCMYICPKDMFVYEDNHVKEYRTNSDGSIRCVSVRKYTSFYLFYLKPFDSHNRLRPRSFFVPSFRSNRVLRCDRKGIGLRIKQR